MKRSALVLIVLLLLSIIPAWAIKPVTAVQETTSAVISEKIYASEDTWIDEDGYVDSKNYRLRVGVHYGSEERAYLKFDLSTLPENAIIVRATLTLHAYYHSGSRSHNITVYGVLDDSWSEDTLTWNNQPTDYTGVLNWTIVELPNGNVDSNVSWDVTDFVKSQFEEDKVVSFYLHSNLSDLNVNDYIYFNSKESSHGNHPCLEIVYEVSEPPQIPVVPIQEIQSNTTDGDASAYVGQTVQTEGVVTTVTSRGFFIQNGTGPWSGIYVYTGSTPDVSIGDLVQVTGKVNEHKTKNDNKGLTEIDVNSMEDIVKLGTAEVPDPVLLPTGNVSQERWESVLVRVENAIVTNTSLGYGEWEADDGSGPVRIDDMIYKYDLPKVGDVFRYIVGVVYYSYGDFKIEPRDADDMALAVPEILNLNVNPKYVDESMINVTVRNNYDHDVSVTLNLTISDGTAVSRQLTLGPQNTSTVSYEWNPAKPGKYTIEVKLYDDSGRLLDSKNTTVEVSFGFGIASYSVPEVVLVEEPQILNFTIASNYSTAKKAAFTVTMNGTVIYQNDSLEVPAGGEIKVAIPWSAPRYGTYEMHAVLKMTNSLGENVTVKELTKTIFAQYNVTPVATEEIIPTEDAYSYYYNGTEFSWKDYHPYNEKRELAIGNSSKYSKQRAYFKFEIPELSGDTEIISAEFEVYVPYIGDLDVPMDVGVYKTTTDWNESKTPSEPPIPDTLLAHGELSKGWVSWNITEFVRNNTGKTVALLLKLTDESIDNYAWIYSKENQDLKPHLKITYRIPLNIEEVGNTTVAVVGNATVEKNESFFVVEVGGKNYTFNVTAGNLIVDTENIKPDTPSLVAYWKAKISGVETKTGEYRVKQNLKVERHVIQTNVTVHLAMEDPSVAVLLVPWMGDTVRDVVVTKGSQNITLEENDTTDELGYYYITSDAVVVVLKKDPTDVTVVFESSSTVTKTLASEVFYRMALFYTYYLRNHNEELEDAYAQFQNLTSELEARGVDLKNVPVDEINSRMQGYRESFARLPEITDIVSNQGGLGIITAFRVSRQAFVLYKSLMDELAYWNKVLSNALTAAENNQSVVIIPRNVSVLIDLSHDQYYGSKVGINGLVSRITKEFGWNVEMNHEPITYDKLKNYNVVIILNPKIDLSSEEIAALRKYVEEGGGLIIAGDWYKYVNPSLNELLSGYGITLEKTELMDDDHNSGKPYYPYVGAYNRNTPITKFIPDGWMTYYHGDTLTVEGNAVWVIKAFETSYAVDADGNVVNEKGSQPVVAAAVEVGKGRIIVYGSSRAFSDSYYGKYIASNWPFIKGALLWLVGEI